MAKVKAASVKPEEWMGEAVRHMMRAYPFYQEYAELHASGVKGNSGELKGIASAADSSRKSAIKALPEQYRDRLPTQSAFKLLVTGHDEKSFEEEVISLLSTPAKDAEWAAKVKEIKSELKAKSKEKDKESEPETKSEEKSSKEEK